MEDNSFETEIKLEFLTECEELLSEAETAFLRLEKERDNEELVNEIFRLAHNLKGSSRAVGFHQMAELTHVAETFVLKIKDKTFIVTDAVISALLSFKDQVSQMRQALKLDLEAQIDITEVLKKLNVDYSVTANIENPAELAVPNEAEFPKENIEIPIESQSAAISEQPPTDNQVQITPVEKPIETAKKPKIQKLNIQNEEETIRVSLSRIDELNNMIGELVILQTILSQRKFSHIKDELSIKSITQMSKIFNEAQELSLSLRMIPLKSTFQKMERIVRDASISLHKDAKLDVHGETTEVDKTVLQKLTDPLVHILRNAIDHGLENQEERAQSKKSTTGIITLRAYHEGNNLVVEVSDDGRGIHTAKLLKKAVEKGLVSGDKVMTEEEIIDLIFLPGFSTASQVTDISGRGVGMDVVRTNIEQLGGVVKVKSKVGSGSTFKIILPLTLAIIDGLILISSGDRYVVPLAQVDELINLKVEKIDEFSHTAKLFKNREEVIPIFELSSKLIPKNKKQTIQNSAVVLIVRGLAHPFGVAVEDIIAQQQIVIKNLGRDLSQEKGIMGSAIMGDGKPLVIIDLFEIFRDEVKNSTEYRM